MEADRTEVNSINEATVIVAKTIPHFLIIGRIILLPKATRVKLRELYLNKIIGQDQRT